MELLITLLIGLGMIAMGVYMMLSGNCSMLHSYHYATTPEALRPVLARETGAAMCISGIGVALIPFSLTFGMILLFGGIAFMLFAIVRRNGSLFSFVGKAPSGNANPNMNLAVIICVVVGLICAIPGIIMLLTGDPSMLHDYHYANVAPGDLATLARLSGAFMILLGASLAGAVAFASRADGDKRMKIASIVCSILLAVAFIGSMLVIVHFNGTLIA